MPPIEGKYIMLHWLPALKDGGVHLAAEHVEVVGRCGAVDQLEVGVLHLLAKVGASAPLLRPLIDLWQNVRVLVRHLQEALHAGATVLRALRNIAQPSQIEFQCICMTSWHIYVLEHMNKGLLEARFRLQHALCFYLFSSEKASVGIRTSPTCPS